MPSDNASELQTTARNIPIYIGEARADEPVQFQSLWTQTLRDVRSLNWDIAERAHREIERAFTIEETALGITEYIQASPQEAYERMPFIIDTFTHILIWRTLNREDNALTDHEYAAINTLLSSIHDTTETFKGETKRLPFWYSLFHLYEKYPELLTLHNNVLTDLAVVDVDSKRRLLLNFLQEEVPFEDGMRVLTRFFEEYTEGEDASYTSGAIQCAAYYLVRRYPKTLQVGEIPESEQRTLSQFFEAFHDAVPIIEAGGYQYAIQKRYHELLWRPLI